MTDQYDIVTGDGQPTEITVDHESVQGLVFIDPESMPDLEAAPVGISVVPQYIEFKTEGQKFRGVLVGFITMHTQNGDQRAAVLQNREGFWINAGVTYVQAMEKIIIGTPVEVEYKGKQKTASGFNVMLYDVRMLQVKMPNIARPQGAHEHRREIPSQRQMTVTGPVKQDMMEASVKARALRLQLKSDAFKPGPNEFWVLSESAGMDKGFSQNIINSTKNNGKYDFRAALTVLLDELDLILSRDNLPTSKEEV